MTVAQLSSNDSASSSAAAAAAASAAALVVAASAAPVFVGAVDYAVLAAVDVSLSTTKIGVAAAAANHQASPQVRPEKGLKHHEPLESSAALGGLLKQSVLAG